MNIFTINGMKNIVLIMYRINAATGAGISLPIYLTMPVTIAKSSVVTTIQKIACIFFIYFLSTLLVFSFTQMVKD
jgi:hypothetical protein